jgi:hypothetical protein
MVPVLMLYAKGKPGALIVVHENNLAAVASELAPDRAGLEPSPMNPDQTTPVNGVARRRTHYDGRGRLIHRPPPRSRS